MMFDNETWKNRTPDCFITIACGCADGSAYITRDILLCIQNYQQK